MKIALPGYVSKIIAVLQKSGYEAWAVGGCVRDTLLGRTPYDWDITTSALPEAVRTCLERAGIRVICGSGLRHGTVTAIAESAFPCEITTYRSELGYSDNRHPDEVRFVYDLTTDLSRRDFTVNAMATDGEVIVDSFGGQRDLQARMIRAVGDPELRFCEDALRILRGLRFSSQLGFSIEPPTLSAMRRLAPLAVGVSAERRLAELDKLLSGVSSVMVIEAYGDILFHALGVSGKCGDFTAASRLGELSHDRDILFTLLFGENSLIPADVLKLSTSRKKAIAEMLEMRNEGIPSSRADMLRAMRKYGKNIDRCIEYCMCLPFLCQSASDALMLLHELRSEGACYEVSSLAVGGEDVKNLGFEGKQIGRVLEAVLDAVIRGELPNERTLIMEFLKSIGGDVDVLF